MKEFYSKHKDRDPKSTVNGIVNMLEQAGLHTEVRWTSHPFEGLCSNRVTIAGTNIGTNGKGTSEQYCLASGYAEFMERLQNNILGRTSLSGAQVFERRGFLAAPDERHATPTQIEARHDPVLEGWLTTFGVRIRDERVALLEGLLRLRHSRGDGTLAELPFAAPGTGNTAGRVVWLPAALVYHTCGSNGMAAGNTLEEALVQGLSEIFERHAEAQVLRGKAVPPRIPDEVLASTGLMRTIARIEESGRYEVRVHDASLGRGYPVIMTTIVDRIRSTIGVKFGAHPSLSVAVERTLTEAFQGRDLDDGTSTNRLASLVESANPRNISNIYINNVGVFPTTTFCREPTWNFAPWPSWREKTNAQMLSHMLEILRRDGYRVLVRDASHLGFPSCHILVPGMSETFAPSGDLCEGLLGGKRAHEVLRRFPAISKDEQRELLAIKPHDLSHARPDTFGLPFLGGKMHPCRVFGFLHLTLGEFTEAQECFGVLAQLVEGIGAYFWRAMVDFAGWRADGHTEEEALRLVRMLNLPAIARRVERDVTVAREDPRALFPQLRCPDCERCDLRTKGGCAGLAAQEEAQDKIAHALQHSKITQTRVLHLLEDLRMPQPIDDMHG